MFLFWYKEETFTNKVTDTSTVTVESDHTLYAKWQINSVTVTLDNQGATTAGTASVTATYGSAMPNITIPTKTGYTFGGYYTEANGGGTQYYNTDGSSAKNWDIASATILYAYWIDAIPPETPEKPNLVDTYDTGSSSTDNITNLYSDLIIEGYAEAESTVTIYKDGVYEAETVADGNGYWSATVTNNQNVWTNWTVTATDANGNVSAESEALAIYSDTIVPIITDIETRYAAWTYPYSTSNYEVSPFWQTGIAGSDPQIIFENLNLSDIEAICIELGTEGISKDSSVAIYYSTGGSFTHENMVWNTISAGEYHLRYEIPTGSYTSIRVDIGDGGESYEISGMNFVAASGSSCSCMVNVLNANSDASGIWKYQKYSTLTNSWVDCTNWDQYDSPTEQWVAYRAIDRAGNEGTTSETLHIVP
ncbi:MAG: InlB B-repeat-containing protein [Clostridia bacterium]|nr:InlB B-repeat-containing protein [Clostridia bacterium]